MSQSVTPQLDWKSYWKENLHNPDATIRHFYLQLSGVAYLTAVKEKVNKEGAPVVIAELAAVYGPYDRLKYTPIAAAALHRDLQKVVLQCREPVLNQQKVLVEFRVGELFVKPFIYDFGPRMGEYNTRLSGTLTSIGWVKIDGRLVHTAGEDVLMERRNTLHSAAART